ncbi:heterokaryon incompatibility protein-domain-containing protein [Xylaria scruposa]|nr:heterokaryon incompatibility protein-domain-containing protein [Xylaria scruposa]
MWLLNSCSWEMKEFISYKQAPPYAILTHTWGDEEVSFRDWQSGPPKCVEGKEGFDKIKLCCQQAAADGIEWAWVDTCCIDKTSSAELTEAINSMFQWYQNAAVCYAYLDDVIDDIESNLAGCRWVTRGWTLQELIAPREVVFYSRGWHALGTRSNLSALIATVTGIDESFLTGRSLEHASIAQKMSWAAKRTTSRDEDMAYCLLGIFNVNMPLIYGEGCKAFKRLQEILVHEYPEDLSLLAWGRFVEKLPNVVSDHEQMFGSKPLQFDPDQVTENLFGILADSPKDFEHSGCVVLPPGTASYFNDRRLAPSISHSFGRTAWVKLPMLGLGFPKLALHIKRPPMVRLLKIEFIAIPCGRWDISHRNFHNVIIPVTGFQKEYSRTYEIMFTDPSTPWELTTDDWIDGKAQLAISPVLLHSSRAGDVIIRRHIAESPCLWRWEPYRKVKFSMVDGRIKIPNWKSGPIFTWAYEKTIKYMPEKIKGEFFIVLRRMDAMDHSHDDPAQGMNCGKYSIALYCLPPFMEINSGNAASRALNKQNGCETSSAEERQEPFVVSKSQDGTYSDFYNGPSIEVARDMAIPRDEFRCGITGLADVYVSLERIYLDDSNSDDDDEYRSHRFIDVVDVVVRNP